ncbi:MAG: ferritin-like domain-containing protein, partial [Tissierellia bacterium]|nr:ferritin-like domain-containing protein [Tissierellia bacterium]
MIQENIYKLLNEQVNKEMFSAYLYLDISNYYIDSGLEGFANWFKIQAQEEMDHAMLFIQYMQNNGLSVKLTKIE